MTKLNGVPRLRDMLPPLREYWRQINRGEREAEKERRAIRKVHDGKRGKCRCAAYPWPHRPGGGFCRYPDPPLQKYARPPRKSRPYNQRYAGVARQIARASGLHPVRDKAKIQQLLPGVVRLAKQMKATHPRLKFRDIAVIGCEVHGETATIRLHGKIHAWG